MRSAVIVLLVLGCLKNLSAKEEMPAQCPGWTEFERNLPPCPFNGSRPPEDMPVAGLVVPHNGEHIPESDVVNIAFESIATNPATPPQVFTIQSGVARNPVPAIEDRINKSELTADQKRIAKTRISLLHPDSASVGF